MKRLFICIFAFALVISIFYILMHTGSPDAGATAVLKAAFEMTGAEAAASEIYIRGRFSHSVFDENTSLGFLKELVSGIVPAHGGSVPVFCPIDTDFASGHEINCIIDENKKIQMTVLDQKDPDTGGTCSLASLTFHGILRCKNMPKPP